MMMGRGGFRGDFRGTRYEVRGARLLCCGHFWSKVFSYLVPRTSYLEKYLVPRTSYLECLLLFLLSLPTQAALSDYSKDHPLLFGIDMDYPPLEYLDEDGQPQGCDIEFTKVLMHRLDIPMAYSPNTWENISGDVLSGQVDLAMMVYSPYRKNITNYSRAVFRLYYQMVYRKDVKKPIDIRDWTGLHVAYMASRPVKDTLTKAGAILHEIKNLSQATNGLAKGEYDAVICFRYQANYLLKKYQLTNLKAEDLTLTPREYCYVSNDKELIDRINVELEKMEAEGLMDDIYGDVYSKFGDVTIPMWVWMLLGALVIIFLLVFILFQQRYQRKLQREMERTKLSERLKTVLLGNVSHALRTPLNAIIGFSEVLSSDTQLQMPAEERQQLLTLINSNGQQLLHFINELLELSDIESRSIELNCIEHDIVEVMHGYADEIRPSLKPQVKLEVEGRTEGTVFTDEQLMRFVTMHLLKNAARHTERGFVRLRYQATDKRLRVEVTDSGSGISDGLRQNIFAILSDKAAYVRDEVPGLGLTICKAIVDRCGGTIGIDSPQEGGARFWYELPVTRKSTESNISLS